MDDLSLKRRRDASHWLAAIDELITSGTNELKTSGGSDNMDVSEAAHHLGISESKLYKMTSAKEIPHYRPGKQLQFKKSDLEKFMENKKKNVEKSTGEKADIYVANYPLKKGKYSLKRVLKISTFIYPIVTRLMSADTFLQ